MNNTNKVSNQKLISILQSRIAKRKIMLSNLWRGSHPQIDWDSETFKLAALEISVVQKQDKQIMKALIAAECKYEYHANTCHRLTQEVLKLRRQLASYKLTGKPYISGNAN